MNIQRLLNQTATLYKKLASTNADANVVRYDTGTSLKCRAQYGSDTLITDQYREFKVDVEMWVFPDTDVTEEDRITYEGTNYAVENILIKRGYNGDKHHKKLLLVKEKRNG